MRLENILFVPVSGGNVLSSFLFLFAKPF